LKDYIYSVLTATVLFKVLNISFMGGGDMNSCTKRQGHTVVDCEGGVRGAWRASEIVQWKGRSWL